MITRGRRDVTLNLICRRPTWIKSSVVTRVPSAAGSPLTFTLPALMTSSMARREPSPDCASTFCNFCERGAAGGNADSLGGRVRSRFDVGRAGLREPLATGGVLLGVRRGEARREAGFPPGAAAIRAPSAL